MADELRPDNGAFLHELAECESLVTDIERAEQQYRAGCAIAARSHLHDVGTRLAALFRGDAV